MKLAVVGGGSTYTPELIDGFARLRATFPIDELWLIDPDEHRLELVAGMSRRMFLASGHPGKIVATQDLVAGVTDADFVLIQLRVGGQAARRGDETFPHSCGVIGQETTGPGGFAKALRTVPAVLRVAEIVRQHARPDAWIIDFTNPVGIVTRALLTHGHRAIGLCNAAVNFQRKFARLLQVDATEVTMEHVGLNHLSWERSVYVTASDGARHDALPRLIGHDVDALAESFGMPGPLITLLRSVPSYYLHYYYLHDAEFREQLNSPPRAEVVLGVEAELLEQYADVNVVRKPEALSKRGGAYYSEAAVDLIASLNSDRNDTQVVNVFNNGTLPFLPDDHVIEVSATVGAHPPRAIPVGPVPDDISGLIGHVAAYERLALDAAINGGRDRVVRALLAHPLVGQYDKAEHLTDALLSHNKQYLAWAR